MLREDDEQMFQRLEETEEQKSGDGDLNPDDNPEMAIEKRQPSPEGDRDGAGALQ